MNDMGFHYGKGYFILRKNVRNGKFSAERVAPAGKIHFAYLIGVCLHKYGNACVLKSRNSPVFINKNRHTKYYTVIFAPVAFKPFGVNSAFGAGFNGAVTSGVFVHNKIIKSGVGYRLNHILARAFNKLRRHKSPVSEIKRKGLFFHKNPSVFFTLILMITVL